MHPSQRAALKTLSADFQVAQVAIGDLEIGIIRLYDGPDHCELLIVTPNGYRLTAQQFESALREIEAEVGATGTAT